MVAIRVWLPGGTTAEAAHGEAWVAGRMLVEGTGTRDWRRIADEAESRGVAIGADAGFDAQGVAVDALADDLDRALAWAAELVLDSEFPEERCRWMVRQTIAELEQMEDHPDVKTSWAFACQLYGSQARGRPLQGSVRGLRQLDSTVCRRFHTACLERGAIVSVAGDLDEAAAERAASALFGDLADPRFDGDEGSALSRQEGLLQSVELDDSEQAHWFGGAITVSRNHPTTGRWLFWASSSGLEEA